MMLIKTQRFDGLAKIEVGPRNNFKAYTVHREALIDRSLFFLEALSGNLEEAEERVVRLADCDIETFETYLQLVYRNELACDPDLPSDEDRAVAVQLNLAKHYVFCEMLEDYQAKFYSMRAFRPAPTKYAATTSGLFRGVK